jgi:beta-glucosidase
MIEFPKDFLWGAATSAHQVEGNNSNNDWWEWEARHPDRDSSGRACNHYELYPADFDLAREFGHRAHRLSVEWSRIEPQEGHFVESALSHYVGVVAALADRGLEPVVTLHHFTNPLWFARLGGWENRKASVYFLRFIEKVVPALASRVRYWVTVNEPDVYTYYSYVVGDWPPQKKSLRAARAVSKELIRAHIQAYRRIHALYETLRMPAPRVTLAKNMPAFVACTSSWRDRAAVFVREKLFNRDFLEALIRLRSLDFIGVNYYSRTLVHVRGWGIGNMLMDTCVDNHRPLPKNSLGWDIYPEGLSGHLDKLKQYNLPFFILENGICTADDNQRWDYIARHLHALHRAMQGGAVVMGYLYWSLLDNFEWDKGFGPRFGLVDVDYATHRRLPRPSAYKFAEVCKTGKLT